MALPLWTIVVATFGLIWFLRRMRKPKKELLGKELPGPKGLPIVGSLLELGTHPNEKFCKWSEEYGNLYKVDLGNYTTMVVSDPKLAKEIFSHPLLTGRASSAVFEMYPEEPGMGIVNAEGERWELHRRFLLRQLRDFGFGKSSMEALILDEVNEMIEKYKMKEGKPVDKIKNTVKLAVVNSLWTLLTSKRFAQDDPELSALANNSTDGFNEMVEKGSMLDYIPQLASIMPEYSGFNAIRQVFTEVRTFMEKTLNQKKKEFKDGDLNDFIDVFISSMKEAEGDSSSLFHGAKAERQLIASLFDLFLAGTDTTSTTLAWAVLFLCRYPEAQKKLQEEITYITGDSRKVSVADRPNMVYAVALIDEILRFSSIIPDGLMHRATADLEFHGYHIPQDIAVQPNLWFIHHNPKIWGDPHNFRPERFMTEDGKKYVKSENLQAFQPGRRQCVGETLARDTVFLFLTNVFQRFSVKFDPSQKEPTLDAEPGFVRAPYPYSVIMKDRLKN